MTIASVLLPAILTSLSAGPARQTKPFTFVHITDTHIAAAARAAELRRFVGALSAPGGPSFVINTGDVTELGTDAEFDTYSAAVSDPGAPPVYAIPGNHDVRWAPLGKEAFTRRCGPLYRSFTHEGCHFVLLDSTVVLEHWGHFDGAQLAWLIRDLKKVGRHTPVFLFMHHWLGRTGTNIDNANDLLDIVAPYNVVAAFIGHGHSDLQWRVNGIECFMARGLYQGSHHTVSVRDGAVTVTRHSARPSGETATRLATIPISGRSRPRVDFRWDDAGTPLLARRRFTARLLDPAGKPVVASLRYALDGATARPPAAPEEVHPACEVDVSSCEPGWHNLTVELVTETGDRYERREAFLVDRLDAPVRMKWEQPTGSTIQGSPTLVGNTVYIGSFDGSVYAFDITTGRQLWRRATKGGVFCTPVVADGTVYVGSMDHFLYALDSRTGKVRWRFDTGSPLFAGPAVSDGVVCIGAHRAIHGVAVDTGKALWRVEAGSFFQSRAAASDGLFVLGGWDNSLYCIRAANGQVQWKREMGRTDGGRGRISFYYSPAIASPTIAEGRVYVCTNDGLLHCLTLGDGVEQWAVRAPAGGDTFGYSSPLVHAGRVYLGGLGDKGRGDCYAVDARTGALAWRTGTGADNYDSSPALVGPWIAIGSVEGRLTWLDPRDGALVAAYSPRPGYCFGTPTGTAHVTIIGSMNSRVVALTTPAERR